MRDVDGDNSDSGKSIGDTKDVNGDNGDSGNQNCDRRYIDGDNENYRSVGDAIINVTTAIKKIA